MLLVNGDQLVMRAGRPRARCFRRLAPAPLIGLRAGDPRPLPPAGCAALPRPRAGAWPVQPGPPEPGRERRAAAGPDRVHRAASPPAWHHDHPVRARHRPGLPDRVIGAGVRRGPVPAVPGRSRLGQLRHRRPVRRRSQHRPGREQPGPGPARAPCPPGLPHARADRHRDQPVRTAGHRRRGGRAQRRRLAHVRRPRRGRQHLLPRVGQVQRPRRDLLGRRLVRRHRQVRRHAADGRAAAVHRGRPPHPGAPGRAGRDQRARGGDAPAVGSPGLRLPGEPRRAAPHHQLGRRLRVPGRQAVGQSDHHPAVGGLAKRVRGGDPVLRGPRRGRALRLQPGVRRARRDHPQRALDRARRRPGHRYRAVLPGSPRPRPGIREQLVPAAEHRRRHPAACADAGRTGSVHAGQPGRGL